MWGPDGAGPDEMISRSTVETQPSYRRARSWLERRAVSTCMGSGTGETVAGETGWWAASVVWQADKRWEIRLAFCIKLSNPTEWSYRHLSTDTGIQSLPISAEESSFVPTARCRQSTELQRVLVGRGSALTQAQQLVRHRERSGSWSEHLLEMVSECFIGINYGSIGSPYGSSPC